MRQSQLEESFRLLEESSWRERLTAEAWVLGVIFGIPPQLRWRSGELIGSVNDIFMASLKI